MNSAIQNEMLQLIKTLEEKSLITNEQYQFLKQDFEPTFNLNESVNWLKVRELFFNPGVKPEFEVEPMNSANLCPTFVPVLNKINKLRFQFNADISMQSRQQRYGIILEAIRNVIALHVGAVSKPDIKNIALVRNTSEANNQLSKGYKLWEGNTVLLWDENHPTNNNVWKLRETETKKVKTFSLNTVDFINWTDEQIVKEICDIIIETIKNIPGKTVMLSFSEVSNISGICMPSKEIVERVRAAYPEIHIHIDGAVSWGGLEINLIEKNNVKGIGCDSFASSSHKWLMGPFETGIFYMKPELAKNFDISIHAYDGKIGFKDELPKDTSRFELLGQRDEANIYALGETIAEHNKINKGDPKCIEKRVKFLQKDLRRKLNLMAQELGVKIEYTTPTSEKLSNGVTIFNIVVPRRTINHQDLYNYLYGKKGEQNRFAVGYIPERTTVSPCPESLRICPHIMNLPNQISAIVIKIATFIRQGHNITPEKLEALTVIEA
ncbi:aminotransferase class V-fold PLP-dependent enzyme [Kordia sp. YSTF-M3]|uniref:Aminotransferase class V-fold PLP-dependent enzyme n=1 Tax=Kordia aestuariivivens TaxID=2759037 RepID=A0ABR7QCT0_9FLAO|nr:aminotransferase class V-fold PLP-dependent enzyme [Kordia aestuariivivens]MBC8756374.1 aminotransferase class V-fold PLP-dependent enzyme [Kordia aestuariivivens]